ncbi:MAG: type I 3-dehydroquinate dehydratase, partial [Chlamydiia bacterium]|nr:type I 3-dehydroquinate dehydratase [Chlamydiia bacterium]
MLVATIQGSLQQVKKGIQKGGKGADALEFRLDLMEKIDRLTLSKLMKKISLPVIFTLRRKNQGGAFKGNER